MKEAKGSNSPVVRLKATAKEFNFSKLRADQDNKLANSGETMFLDFQRMNFVVNGKAIDKNLTIAFKEGAKDYKNEIFNRDNFDNLSEEGKAFMAPILKELDQDRLPEIWENHCNSPTVADEQKTYEYKKEFERFYNAGRSSYHLFPKKDYRALAKEIFKEMFRYAGAEVPSDAILEELVTNCNQAGYEAAPFIQTQLGLGQSFIVESPQKVINIDCSSQNNVRIRSDMKLPIFSIKDDMHGGKICDLLSSLKFTIESYDGEGFVTYGGGKLLLTVPEELKNYKIGDKSVFEIIKEYFETFCAKLGFKFETEIQIEHDLGQSLKVLDNTISTPESDANKKFINLLSKNLRERLLGSGVALEDEDVDGIVEVRVSTVMDLLSDYAKLEDNKENRELLINEVADNLGLFTQDKTVSEVLMELSSLPSLIRDQVDHSQVEFVANIFADLITTGKREIYEEQEGAINPIDAIRRKIQKVSNTIVEQEATNKQQGVEVGKWTHMIEEQKLSVKSHGHLH